MRRATEDTHGSFCTASRACDSNWKRECGWGRMEGECRGARGSTARDTARFLDDTGSDRKSTELECRQNTMCTMLCRKLERGSYAGRRSYVVSSANLALLSFTQPSFHPTSSYHFLDRACRCGELHLKVNAACGGVNLTPGGNEVRKRPT